MIRFTLTKLVGLVATLLVAAVVVFLALDVLPGDPARFMLGANAAPEAVEALRVQLALDAPAWQRFLGWVGGMLVGDFGRSATQAQPVGALIAGGLAVTIPLTILSMLLSACIGLPLGLLAARKRGSPVDAALMALARIGIATPNFWLGMVLVLLFSVTLRWLPTGGFVLWSENPGAALASLVLPAIALALPLAAVLARAMREAMADVQQSDFIRTASASGLTAREAVWRHGLRNAMLPVLSILGPQFGYLIAGTVIVENVFYLPGFGRLIFDAMNAHDLIVVRSSVIVLVLAIAGTIFLVDLVYAWTDPRLRARRAP